MFLWTLARLKDIDRLYIIIKFTYLFTMTTKNKKKKNLILNIIFTYDIRTEPNVIVLHPNTNDRAIAVAVVAAVVVVVVRFADLRWGKANTNLFAYYMVALNSMTMYWSVHRDYGPIVPLNWQNPARMRVM